MRFDGTAFFDAKGGKVIRRSADRSKQKPTQPRSEK
jgi:hypothetical protein